MKSERCLAAGEKGLKTKLPPYESERSTGVSGEDPVPVIPPVRIRDGVGIDVPTVAIPVNVHRAEHQLLIPEAIYITAP